MPAPCRWGGTPLPRLRAGLGVRASFGINLCTHIAILIGFVQWEEVFLGGCAPKPPLALTRVYNHFRTAIANECEENNRVARFSGLRILARGLQPRAGAGANDP
jgi:hypothetical protein